MSQHVDVATRPAGEVSADSTSGGQIGAGRQVGVDLARGLAVFGMYAAHVGPAPYDGGVTGFLMELTHGRSSALFALLAGFGVVLITGRPVPKTGQAGRQAVAKVIVRAVVLLALGTALTMTGNPVQDILAFYGLYFLLVLPLHRLRVGALAATAVGAALVLPQVRYLLEQAIGTDHVRAPDDPDGLVSLLVTGTYPALTWVPYVLAGMAVARLDLASGTVRRRLALTGTGLAVAGYGGSWVALRLVPGAARDIASTGFGGDPGDVAAWWSDTAGFPSGDTPAWLLAASPHSETTLSILGNTGVALAVLAACVVATASSARLRRLAGPAIAVGSMSLTAYVLHVAGIGVLGIDRLPGSPLPVLVGFVAAVSVFAVAWSHFFRRGPLEALMEKATGVARTVP